MFSFVYPLTGFVMTIQQEQLWDVADLLFSNRDDLYRFQFDSYDFFIEKVVPQEIRNNSTMDEHEDVENNAFYSYRFEFENFSFRPATLENGKDYMTPMTARHRQLSYFGTVVCDVKQVQERTCLLTGEKKISTVVEEKGLPVARLPIMLKSKYCTTTIVPETSLEECPYDPGCYFIVNGSEKVVLSIERMAPNKIFVYEKKKDGDFDYRAVVTSQRDDIDGISYGYNVKLRMKEALNGILFSANGIIDAPVAIVLRALGVQSDEDLVEMALLRPVEEDIEMSNLLLGILQECKDEKGEWIRNKEDAITYLANRPSGFRIYSQNPELRARQKRAYIEKILREDMLPHIQGDWRSKAAYICLMIHKMLSVSLGRMKPDDRDTFVNKRIETPGILLGQLFRQTWNKMIKECGLYFRKKNVSDDTPAKVINQIKPATIEQSMRTALLTGRWGLSKTKHGVARVLERLSYIQSVAQFRRIITPTLDEKNSKISSMRHVHASQMGFLCTVETPEGEKIGLVKNLTINASITTSDLVVGPFLKDLIRKDVIGFDQVPFKDFYKVWKVIVNGDYVGFLAGDSIEDFVKKFVDLKLRNVFSRYTSISLDAEIKEIRFFTDGGRLIRPLLRVLKGSLMLQKKHIEAIPKMDSWQDFISRYPDVIEFIDVEQSPFTLIAMYAGELEESLRVSSLPPQTTDQDRVNRYGNTYNMYTHCEIHPSLTLGMTISTVPFCNMNQAPRNQFQFAQAKQAMGIYASNWMNRFDISNVLYHPQVPVVFTRGMDYTGLMDLPNGENVIVAIAPYTGYNQEDSCVINASSVARGLFRSSYLKKYTSTIEKNQVSSQDDIHTKPDRNLVANIKANVNYDKLNDQGYIEEETVVVEGDAILGKVSPITATEKSSKIFKDKSEVYKGFHPGVVDKVQTGILNGDGYEMYKMRIRSERIPQVGDKFSNRSGQKSTCGILIRQEDMPFTENGLVPDMIINPNCIPSRMTIGQLLESVLSKTGALKGQFRDGTPFEHRNVESICDELESMGYNRYGCETVYSGVTGRKMEAQLFIGPTYYQRLKHMVADKIHARATGPTVLLTRQPPEGRTKNGGLRFGEMERDCAISHGAAEFLKERMMECSDKYAMHICDQCGLIASRLKNHPGFHCKSCDNTTDISLVEVPYAFKLFMQELMSVNILCRLRTDKAEYDDI